MRKELNDIENIEKYLEGQLTKEEVAAFEQELSLNPSLQEAVSFQAAFVQQIKEQAFLKDLKAFQEAYPPKNEATNRSHVKRNFWMVIVFSVLLFFSFFWWSSRNTESSLFSSILNRDITQVSEETTSTVAINPTDFQEQFIIKQVDNSKGGKLPLSSSASTLHIPPKAVCFSNGEAVVGVYEIHYRVYRNAAQMAFANIPLHTANQRFHSAGMIEIRAYKNDQELSLVPDKAIRLDFSLTERMDSLALYHLQDSNKTWYKIEEIVLPLSMRMFKLSKRKEEARALEELKAKKKQIIENIAKLAADSAKAHSSDDTSIIRIDNRVDVGAFRLNPIADSPAPKLIEKPLVIKPLPTPQKHIVKHRHHPKLVKNLALPAFGCYNVAQKRPIANKIIIQPRYLDIDRQMIPRLSRLSVIDLACNAAYSFGPDEFICDRHSANVFLLWTNDGKLYSFFKSKQQSISPKTVVKISLTMDDIGDEVSKTADLEQYLRQLKRRTKKVEEK